jgi:hypothetical protein
LELGNGFFFFLIFFKTNMGWGEMGEHHVLSLSLFLILGLGEAWWKGGMSMGFFLSFPYYGWDNNGRAWSYSFFKNRPLVGWGEG